MSADPNNVWRQSTPGVEGWTRTARPSDPDKYFMVSADCHANEPHDLWQTRMIPEYRDRVPTFTFDEKQKASFQVAEGFRPMRIHDIRFEGEDAERNGCGRTPEERLADHARDGVDAVDLPQADVGHLGRVAEIEAQLPESIFVTGSSYRGIGVPDCVRQGRETAKLALESMIINSPLNT